MEKKLKEKLSGLSTEYQELHQQIQREFYDIRMKFFKMHKGMTQDLEVMVDKKLSNVSPMHQTKHKS